MFVRLLRKHTVFFTGIFLLGILNSLLFTGILVIINDGIRPQQQLLLHYGPYEQILLFLGILVFAVLVRQVFQRRMIRFSSNILFDFELSVLQKIRLASYEAFQKLGQQKVYTAIGDTKVIGQLPRFFVDFTTNLVVIVCTLLYLAWVSLPSTFLVILLSAVLVSFYVWRNKAIAVDLNRIRDLENDYYRYLQDLLKGFREVKMSTVKNNNLYHQFLEKNRLRVKDLEISASIRYMNNELFGQLSWYVILGMVVFLLPHLLKMDFPERTTFVIVVLYLMGPFNFIISSFGFLTRLKIAIHRINRFEEDLQNLDDNPSGQLLQKPLIPPQKIRFEGITYRYKGETPNRQFSLGPFDLELNAGETIFVSGENGSGKSTFIYLLAGLIQPDTGRIYVDGQLLTPDRYAQYSNLLASVFVDAHLFSEQYEDFDLTLEWQQWDDLGRQMRLTDILRLDTARQVADHNLSKGQQKRLMMMYALMENKPLLLLDEWAAEQDPSFRAYFYRDLLPLLKDRGKTIIAITHDDRYFTHADRMITFHDGLLVADVHISSPQPVSI